MTMNEGIRRTVNAAVVKQSLTQKSLAERVGMSQPAVGRILTGTRKGDPDSWQRILDALGLELIAVPKGAEVHDRRERVVANPSSEPTAAPVKAPERKRRAVTEEGELPPEVEDLRRRWKAGEFKTRDVPTEHGTYLAPQAHKELGFLFGGLKQPRNRKQALTKLLEIAELLSESGEA